MVNYLDFLVENQMILEIKSAKELDKVHKQQVLKYLMATEYPCALLVNFGALSLESERILPTQKIQIVRNRRKKILNN